VLVIIEPLAFIFGPVVMLVCSVSAGLVVFPLPVVYVSVDMGELASVKIKIPLPLALPFAHYPSYFAPSGQT
jgi:hypothetical protein